MVKTFLWGSAFTTLLLGFVSCSFLKKKAFSFYLDRVRDEQARKVDLSFPPVPYEKQTHPTLDAMWWNPQSRSSISYFSSCSKVKRTLKEFQASAFPQSLAYKTLQSVLSKHSLYSVLEIRNLSKHKTYTGIHTMRKGQCLFNIHLMTSSFSSFQKEEKIFQSFIKGFYSK